MDSLKVLDPEGPIREADVDLTVMNVGFGLGPDMIDGRQRRSVIRRSD